jgi:hypothetical protein
LVLLCHAAATGRTTEDLPSAVTGFRPMQQSRPRRSMMNFGAKLQVYIEFYVFGTSTMFHAHSSFIPLSLK